MWESLANSRRQDRALHGAAKLLNLVVGIIVLPLWLAAQRLSGPLRRLLQEHAEAPELPVPPPQERSMEALIADLREVPSRLRSSPRFELRKLVPDLSSFVLSQNRETANIGYSYPGQFSDEVFEAADGTWLGSTVALHRQPRPGLIVVHGLFSTRRFDYVRQVAVRAYYEWGFNVMAIDLRSFGLSELLSEAPSTGGWKEGEDLLFAARHLKALGATSVGAWGVSLGGSAVLGASFKPGAEDALDGGVLAISPPADVGAAADRLSRIVGLRHPAYALNYGFRAMLLSRVRSSRWPAEVSRLSEAIDQVSAAYYEISPEEVRRRSSAVNGIAEARVPVLILHPEDDQIIPVDHARMLEREAADNPNVQVWILPGGGHGAIDVADRHWAWTVYRSFFERSADYPENDRDRAEMVYSSPATGKVKLGG
jgi:predicted alpha/beta-fold hydrolase